mmetsp:Transcript_23062/g.34172  ORF Transcript_23062/g.34172 Transcript_23062/m.34172 type:complete len:275 (+) Transcript_23062:312-1136(+)
MTGCGRFISLLLLLSIEPSLLALATTTGGTSSSSSSSSSDSVNINYDKNDGGTATLHPPIYNNDSKNENNSNNRSDRDGNNNLQNFHVEKTLAPVLSLAKIGLTFQHQQQQQRAHEPSTIVHYTCFGSLQSEADSSETESSSSTRHHQDQNQKNEDRHHNHHHNHHHRCCCCMYFCTGSTFCSTCWHSLHNKLREICYLDFHLHFRFHLHLPRHHLDPPHSHSDTLQHFHNMRYTDHHLQLHFLHLHHCPRNNRQTSKNHRSCKSFFVFGTGTS